MKYLPLFLLVPAFIYAQDHVTIVQEEYGGFAEGEVSVFKVEAELVTKKALMDHWYKYLKADAVEDIVRSDNELRTNKFPFRTMSNKAVNVYMHFEDMDNGTRSYIAFEDSATGFISISNPDHGIAIKKKIYEETHLVYVEAMKEQIKMEKNHLGDLESDYNDLLKDKDKLSKNILDAEQEIDKIKNDIKINEGVLAELTNEVADQRSELNAMGASTPEEIRKKAEKELSSAEKKRDKMRKQIDKDRKSIYDLEADIREYQYEIEKLQPNIDLAKRKVDDQRALVSAQEEDLYHKQRGH